MDRVKDTLMFTNDALFVGGPYHGYLESEMRGGVSNGQTFYPPVYPGTDFQPGIYKFQRVNVNRKRFKLWIFEDMKPEEGFASLLKNNIRKRKRKLPDVFKKRK